jgi:GDPmannose 4,6-dehydratase
MRRALITGISGQDGSYLAEYLLDLNYEVWGVVRRDAESLRWLQPIRERIEFVYGDLRDPESLGVAFRKAWPDEVYNLAGQVFVPTSWEQPAATFDINVGGLARLLQLMEGLKPDTRLYQASSSEMFGNFAGPCNAHTPLQPASPYGISKMAAHRLVEAYRARGLFAVGGILFNHESPRRGPEMVTRKITRAAASWVAGDRTKLRLGDLQARRDWGFAGDYVKAMHAMLQQPVPKDYVIGTGVSHSVADFATQALIELRRVSPTGQVPASLEDWVDSDPSLLRTGEIHSLVADAGEARRELHWEPTVDFKGLVRMMVKADIAAVSGSNRSSIASAAP